MAKVGDSAHTDHGLGTITEVDSIRGGRQFRVAGRGFDVWVPEIRLRLATTDYTAGLETTIEQGDTNENNSTTLPYDPSPQYPVDLFRQDQTILPGDHEIDPKDRLHPSDSLSKDRADANRPYPGPSPDLFAKGAGKHDQHFWKGLSTPPAPSYVVQDAHEWLATHPEGEPEYAGPRHQAGLEHQAWSFHDEDSEPEEDRWARFNEHAQQGYTGHGEPHHANYHYAEEEPFQGDPYKEWGDDEWHSDLPDGPERTFGKDASYRPAGLSNRYAHLIEPDDERDPITAFRRDPMEFMQRRAYVMTAGEEDHLYKKFADYDHMLESDPQLRTAAWTDVRQKAQRLRHEGRVEVNHVTPQHIYATVKGDHGTYDTMIVKGASGAFSGGQAISNWSCDCDWGKWAFQRKVSYVGRLCSHAYAAYLDMQSHYHKDNQGKFKAASIVDDFKSWAKENNDGHLDRGSMTDFINTCDEHVTREEAEALYDHLLKNVQTAPERDFDVPYTLDNEEAYKTAADTDALRQRPLSLTPDLRTVPQGEENQWTDVTKDDRETTGPDQILHFGALASKLHAANDDVMSAAENNDAGSLDPMTAALHRTGDWGSWSDIGRSLNPLPVLQRNFPNGIPLPGTMAPRGQDGGLPQPRDVLNPSNWHAWQPHIPLPANGGPASPSQPTNAAPVSQVTPGPNAYVGPDGKPVPFKAPMNALNPPSNAGQRLKDMIQGKPDPGRAAPGAPPSGPGSPPASPPSTVPSGTAVPNTPGQTLDNGKWVPNWGSGGNNPQGTGAGPGGAKGTGQGFGGAGYQGPGGTGGDWLKSNETSGIGGNSYTVKPGETLNDIAQRSGLSVQDISKANKITDPNQINTGQQLDLSTLGGGTGGNKTADPVPGANPGGGQFVGQETLKGVDTPKPGAPSSTFQAPQPPKIPTSPTDSNSMLNKGLSDIHSHLLAKLHHSASVADDDEPRPDTGKAADMLQQLRNLSEEAPSDHYQDMDSHNEEVRDLVEKLNDAGVDAMPFVAHRLAAPQSQRKDSDPSDGDANFAGRSNPNWADEPFNGSGPDPQLWMSDSASWIDQHERPDFTDVTDLPDGDIIKFNDSRSKPQQGPRHGSYTHLLHQADGPATVGDYSNMNGFDPGSYTDGESAVGGSNAVMASYRYADDDGYVGDGMSSGYFNPANPTAEDWEEGSGDPFMHQVDQDAEQASPSHMLPKGLGGGGGEGAAEGEGAAAAEGPELAELAVLAAFDRGEYSFEDSQGGPLRAAHRAGGGPTQQVRVDQGVRGWQRQAQTYSPPEGFGNDGDPELTAYGEPSADPGMGADVVASFQRSAGALEMMHGSGPAPGSLDDFGSSPMVQSMLRTAGRKYSPEEQRMLEAENHPLGARNLPTEDDLQGTHYLLG